MISGSFVGSHTVGHQLITMIIQVSVHRRLRGWIRTPKRQESIIPFRNLCNPAHSWRDYRLVVHFPTVDFEFSVVTSYFLNERETASQNDSITAYTRELCRADQAYGPGVGAALLRDFNHFGLTATNFLRELPAVLATLPCYFVYV